MLVVTDVSSSTSSLNISWVLGRGVTPINYTLIYHNTDTDCFNGSNVPSAIATDQTMYKLLVLEEGSEYSINLTVTVCEMEEIVEENVRATTTTAG